MKRILALLLVLVMTFGLFACGVAPLETTGPVESLPIVTQPGETDPIETEPVETEPVETQPIETEPEETELLWVNTKPQSLAPVSPSNCTPS